MRSQYNGNVKMVKIIFLYNIVNFGKSGRPVKRAI